MDGIGVTRRSAPRDKSCAHAFSRLTEPFANCKLRGTQQPSVCEPRSPVMSESFTMVTSAQLLRRVKAEYIEMPGLRLTVAQAGRLWGLDPPACVDVLDRLITERFLQRRPDGT